MTNLNQTHSATLKSWVDSANQPDTNFPIQNLPYGAFGAAGDASIRLGVAIGDMILDLGAVEAAGLLPTPQAVFSGCSLNPFMSLDASVWSATRAALSGLLAADNARLRDDSILRQKALVAMSDCALYRPFEVTAYTDFYSSREHATNVGTMFRDPDNALMPNWLHIPIGYNGRASTVVVSDTDISRPLGQTRPPGSETPLFGPSQKLDIELEVGAIVGTPNAMGVPVSVSQADSMIFGYLLLNDWSARDVQVWEYQPLGPFQSKAFATTISPWVVTQEALEPFRVNGPTQEPTPLPYLRHKGHCNFDINLFAHMQSASAETATTICSTNFKHMYWSSAQQLTHHAISGCAMQTGDLLGSGTISGSTQDSFGSLLELTWNGKNPITLEDGSQRCFIEDGDTLTLTGWAQGDGYRIGFGDATGTILPAVNDPSRLFG